jgi:MFS family permease
VRRITLGALAEPAFRRFFVGNAVSALGSRISPLALTFGILGSGASTADLGLVLGASAVPTLFLVLLGGVIGDRLERRRILIGTDLVMAACQGATAWLFLSGVAQIWQLVGIQLVMGTADAFFSPASTGIVRDIVSLPRLQQANSLLGISRNLSGIIGPAIAGIMVAVSSPGWALVLDAATFVVSAVALSRIPASVGRAALGTSILRDLADGWREFTSRSWVWLMVLSFLVYQASVLPATYVLGPTIANEKYGGAAAWAAILSARSVGALAVSGLLLRWRPPRPLVFACLAILLDIPFLGALVLGWPLAVVLGLGALASAGLVGGDTAWETTLQERVPQHALSRVSAYDWLGSLAMNPVGFALIGVVAAARGEVRTLAVVLAVHIVVHVLLIMAGPIRAVRREPLPQGVE